MYRDLAQWSGIRDQILRKGVSIRQVVRETGISYTTVRKMLDYRLPQPYPPRSRRYPKLGPHTGSVQRILRANATLPPRPASPSRPSTSVSEIRRVFAAATAR